MCFVALLFMETETYYVLDSWTNYGFSTPIKHNNEQ